MKLVTSFTTDASWLNSRIGPAIANLDLVVKLSSMGGAGQMIASM